MEPASFSAPDRLHLLREPVRGRVAYAGLAALPGVDQVRAFSHSTPSVTRSGGRVLLGGSDSAASRR
jgi:hypothetical protein